MKKEQKPTPPEIRKYIRTLIANLIGEKDRTDELDYPLDANTVPWDMDWERLVMDKHDHLVNQGYTPTRENILGLMTIDNVERAEPRLDDLLQERTDPPDVSFLSHQVFSWNTKYRMDAALDEAETILASPYGTPLERAEHAVAVVQAAAPTDDYETQVVDDRQRLQNFIENQRKRYERNKAGLSNGPRFPFMGIHGGERIDPRSGQTLTLYPKIPVLNMRDLTLITGEPGFGKTTLAWILGEHNAWDLGFDVFMPHLETSPEILEIRQIARNASIRPDALSTGYLSPDDPRLVQGLTNFQKQLDNAKGTLYSLHCPEWDISKIVTMIHILSRRSQKNGRQLIVIVDYLQKIEYAQFKGQPYQFYGAITEKLKNAAEKFNTHVFLFSQESDSGNGGKKSFGSSEPVQKCQVHISVERDTNAVTEDWPVFVYDPKTKQRGHKQDRLGHLMYYHRKGDKRNAKANLIIHKANNGETGMVEVHFVNAYFDIRDPE